MSVRADEAPKALEQVVVSGSRSEQMRDDLPLSMDVFQASDLEERQINDIRTWCVIPTFRSVMLPRFSITGASNSTGRDANVGFTISRNGANRKVLMLMDGARCRAATSMATTFGRDSLAFGTGQAGFEIVRGPSSVCMAPMAWRAVNFITNEPTDYLGSGAGAQTVARRLSTPGVVTIRPGAAATVAGQGSSTVQWMLTGVARRPALNWTTRGSSSEPNAKPYAAQPPDNRETPCWARVV